jgi:hypothetical protein
MFVVAQAQGNGSQFQKKKVQAVKRFVLWKGSKESTGPLMVGGFQEVSWGKVLWLCCVQVPRC